MLRAYDKRLGTELAALQLPAPQSGSPMTYMVDGRQYYLTPAGNALTAFALPQ